MSVSLRLLEQPPCRNLRLAAPVLEHGVLVWSPQPQHLHAPQRRYRPSESEIELEGERTIGARL
jgi:hypothetical protein